MMPSRVRVRPGKAKKWRKGQSSSSNPETREHRKAAKGKFGSHLSQTLSSDSPNPLTEKALASHDAATMGTTGDLVLNSNESESVGSDDRDSLTLASIKSVTSVASGTVYSLMETAHPVFRKLKNLWNSPLETHREVCAVLAAVSEVVKTKEGTDSESEYFGALMTALETSEEEKSAIAVSFLLSLILPKVPRELLVSRYSSVCKVIANKLVGFESSNSTSLLKSLVTCLSGLLEAQDKVVWSEGYTQRIFQLLLNYTVHPKPKLRKAAQNGVVSLLREGTLSGEHHPCTALVAKHCRQSIERQGLESTILHVLGMLKDCLANFPTKHIKALSECVLKLMTLGNSMMRTTGLKVFNGLFSSIAGPQGLTTELTAQLLSALQEQQPSVVDAQLLTAWLTVEQSVYKRLYQLNSELFLAHLPRLVVGCVTCLLSDRDHVKNTVTSVLKNIFKECVAPCLTAFEQDSSGKPRGTSDQAILVTLKSICKGLEGGLKYKFTGSWDHVLEILGVFYEVAGRLTCCHSFLTKSLTTICELRVTTEFPFKSEVDSAFAAAFKSMGARVVLKAVPLQFDLESGSHDFPRSWLLPVMRDSVANDELSYFTEHLLPLAAKLRARAREMSGNGQLLETKLYETLQYQIWSVLPGFCTCPTDLPDSFSGIARILGTALKENRELRPFVCQALQALIESNKDNELNKKEIARFSKNYLPILFELYVGTAEGSKTAAADRGPLIKCISVYVSITDSKLLQSFLSNALNKLTQDEVTKFTKQLLLDLVQSFVPYLPQESLDHVLTILSPFLDAGNPAIQKKAYGCIECLLSSNLPAHKEFVSSHLVDLRKLLLESLSTASPASKKPRLKCLLSIVDQLTPDSSDFIVSILPEVILCTKEVNEKTRNLSFKLAIQMGYAAQRCYSKNPEGCVMDYFVTVLAGLAGSAHMISATIVVLARLLHEFHDLLGTDVVKKLLKTVCAFLSSKVREVVKSTLEFIKVTINLLPPDELAPHLEELVKSITSWSSDNSNHFRTKSRDIFERLLKKFEYEIIASYVPEKDKKFVTHIWKMVERKKKKKLAKDKKDEVEENNKTHKKLSYDELLADSSDEEDHQEHEKDPAQGRRARGRAWIKEDSADDPVNFLDSKIVQRVVATDPAKSAKRNKQKAAPFETNPEGKLVIAESAGEDDEAGGITEINESMEDMDITEETRMKRKRKMDCDDSNTGKQGGRGIHRTNAHRRDFDFNYGSEFQAKKAKGDIKKVGKPDPYAYVPLLRQKLNRRKQAKLKGQFTGLLQRAKRGSVSGMKKRKKI